MKRWSKTDEDFFASIYTSPEWSIQRIAERFRVSTKTITRKAGTLRIVRPPTNKRKKWVGINPPRWTEEDYDRLRKLWADNTLTLNDIARVMGRPYDAVQYRGRCLGLVPRAATHGKRSDQVFRWKTTPWPKNMPDFENHPDAIALDQTFNYRRAMETRKLGQA